MKLNRPCLMVGEPLVEAGILWFRCQLVMSVCL